MKEYITIGELEEHLTCSVWVGTDKATHSECTVSINGFRTKHGWKNIHVKVKREDLLEYIDRKITLLRLMYRRIPDSLIVQDVSRYTEPVIEKRYVEWPKFLEGMFDWKFDRLRCVDYREIGEFLGVDIDTEIRNGD